MKKEPGQISRFSEQSASHWDNYWGGAARGDDSRDAAVTGAGRSEAFQAAWRAFFQDIARGEGSRAGGIKLTDLACGTGIVTDIAVSTLAHSQLAQSRLVGIDYSISAARQYSEKFRSSGADFAEGVVADTSNPPFRPASVDVVASQFGLEYAGVGALINAGGLVAPNGEIMCLGHYQSGAIELECAENLRVAEAILSSEVLGHARALFMAPNEAQSAHLTTSALQGLDRVGQESQNSAGNRLLTRLRGDLSRLIGRRAAFDPREAISWLEASANEISMYRDRMKSMVDAALDNEQIEVVVAQWNASGLEVEAPSAVTMEDASAPSAWRLRARRPDSRDNA